MTIFDDNGYFCERHVLAKDTLTKNRARKLGHFAIDVLYTCTLLYYQMKYINKSNQIYYQIRLNHNYLISYGLILYKGMEAFSVNYYIDIFMNFRDTM